MSDKTGKTDAWLDDESSVSRAYGELQKTLPPEHIDQHILAEARRVAATEDKTVVRVHRWRKWAMPAALAATAVFAVPLVVRVFETTSSNFDQADAPIAVTEMMAPEAEPGRRESAGSFADAVSPQAMFDEPVATVGARREEESATNPASTERRERLAPARQAAPAAAGDQPGDFVQTPELFAPEPAMAAAKGAESIPERDQTLAAAGQDDDRQRPAELFATKPAMAAAKSADSDDQRDQTPAAPRADVQDADHQRLAQDMAATLPPSQQYAQEENMGAGEVANSNRASSQAQRSNTRTAAPETAVSTAIRNDLTSMSVRAEEDALEETVIVTGSRIAVAAEDWLVEIARLHRGGRVRTARYELGRFFTAHPDYELPDFYPLQAKDALYVADVDAIVPEAETWLSEIAGLAYRGRMDVARMQFAEFLERYPDYPLPDNFPLRREDAVIER